MEVGTNKDADVNSSQTGLRPVYGVLNLDLGAAMKIAGAADAGEDVVIVCRLSNWIARKYLQRRLGKRLSLHVLDRDPYYLPAQEMCDEQCRSFRCDAIESVISVARLMADAIGDELAATLAATNLRDTEDILRRFFRHQAGDAVREHVYLGYHLLSKWQAKRHSRPVLLLPKCWWSTYVATVLDPTGLTIGWVSPPSSISRRASFVARWFVRRNRPAKAPVAANSSQGIQPDTPREPDLSWLSPRKTFWYGVRASGMAFDGLDPRLRNNLGWAWRSDLPLDALVVFWAVKSRPANDLEHKLGSLGAHIVSMVPDEAGQLDYELRFYWPTMQKRFLRLGKAYFQVMRNRPGTILTARGRWLAINMASLLARWVNWHSVFSRMNVRVNVESDYGMETYARAFAMRILGGVTILDQRSHYYDNYDHSSERPGDLAFQSGPCGLRYYSPRLFDVGQIVMTGLGRDGADVACKPLLLGNSEQQPVVALLDEPGTIYGPEHALRFVSSMIEHCVRHGGYRIVLKPKRKDELIAKLPKGVTDSLNRLIGNGRAHVIPSSTSVVQLCEVSDIVVSVPSTAAYLAIGTGKPVLVFNPFHTIRTVFYEHRLDGVHIFVDLDALLTRLSVILASGQFGAEALERTRKVLDPWLDMNGNERKGYFVSQLVRHLSDGTPRRGAIESAMSDYRVRYGENTCGTWEWVWQGASEYAGDLATSPPRFDRANAPMAQNA